MFNYFIKNNNLSYLFRFSQRFISVQLTNDNNLQINWNNTDNDKSLYDHVWLRDNCSCSKCIEISSGQKRFERHKILDFKPNNVILHKNKKNIEIKWNDYHISNYSLDWLKQYSMDDSSRKQKFKDQQPILWNSLFSLKTLSYNDIINDDTYLKEWLEILQNDGICLISNAGKNESNIETIAEKIGPIRETTYGKTWRVESKPNPENIAYTSEHLDLHTDILYYETIPGIQMLHCIKQSKIGGENIFADAFKIAKDFRRNEPNYFKILCNTPITYQKTHENNYRKYRRTLFQLDENNILMSVNFSPQFEGPLETHYDNIRPFYKAYTKWHTYTKDLQYHFNLKLQSGDIITFNNRRILHGRQSFNQQYERLLIGTYVDLDEVSNRLRLLKQKFNDNSLLLKRLGNSSY